MKIGCATVVIAIWTLVAIILHFAGVGAFAVWPVIAGPFTWSCCSLVIWDIILTVGIVLFFLFGMPLIRWMFHLND